MHAALSSCTKSSLMAMILMYWSSPFSSSHHFHSLKSIYINKNGLLQAIIGEMLLKS